jgi:hypothetical protein
MSTKIAVFESRWHHPDNDIQRNTTVRPLFEFLANIQYGTHHAFEYEMVGTQTALDEALGRLARSRRVTVAYLAMHGGTRGLHLHSGQRVSRTHIRNTLKAIASEDGSKLRGLFLGSCLFGTELLAKHLLVRDVGITWVAGYRERTDFLKSTALDLLFFNTWIEVKRNHPGYTERPRIGLVAQRLRVEAQGLVNRPIENGDAHCGLGFSLFVRRKGPGGGVRDLLRDY